MIKITDRYGIDTDEMNYIVSDLKAGKYDKRTNNVYYKQVAFFGSMDKALDHIRKLETRKRLADHDMDLQEAAQIIREEVQRFTEIAARVLAQA